MGSDLLATALAAAALAAGCLAKDGPVCRPVFSWAAPAHGCAAVAPPPPLPPLPAPPPPPIVESPVPELPASPAAPPKATLGQSSIDLREKVQFATSSAMLLGASDALLEQVARILLDHPEITKVRIEGHTDAQGADDKNLELSQARAEAVRIYLEDKGVAAERMVAEGYGETMPIADNKTADGRERNRRVEIRILTRVP